MPRVNPLLRQLLEQSIDYAGLFPPAKLKMSDAVAEYLDILQDGPEWIVDRFICPASRIEELHSTLRRDLQQREAEIDESQPLLELTVVIPPASDGDEARANLQEARDLASAVPSLRAAAYEMRVDDPTDLDGLRKPISQLVDQDVDVYLEIPNGPEQPDGIHAASLSCPDAGFKMRTGGLEAAAFPSSAEVAVFIKAVAELECPFKFTAGLHEPLRYHDAKMGTHRHGFLNVFCASALAVGEELAPQELEAVLDLEAEDSFQFGDIRAKAGEHVLTAETIEALWTVFGGFGSCSVDEPIAGLQRIGLLDQ